MSTCRGDIDHIRFGPSPEEIRRRHEAAKQFFERMGAEIRAQIEMENTMHYKNGREAKNGDKVVLIPSYGSPVIGILYDATAGNDYCNGRIAPISPTDPCPNLKEVLHFDDVVGALPIHEQIPDRSKAER